MKDALDDKTTFADMSIWEKMKKAFVVLKDMLRWLRLKKGSLDHCLNGATVYFHAVDAFGGSGGGFEKVPPKVCNNACAAVVGDPNSHI